MKLVEVPNRDAEEGLYEAVREYTGAHRLHEAVLRLDATRRTTGLT